MNCLCYLLIFMLKVSLSYGQENATTSAHISNLHDKDDIWIWGISNPIIDNRNSDGTQPPITTSPPSQSNDTKTPCDPFVYAKPNFTGRISEIKCQEHYWKLKYNANKVLHEAQCEFWKNSQKVNDDDDLNVPSVIGGHITLPGEYSHMGAIGWRGVDDRWQFKCGSTLISPNFVLTAAHCSSASGADTSLADTAPKIIRFMARDLRGPIHKDVNIGSIIMHPNYTSPKKNYDIALMKLAREIIFNYFAQPACLWTKPDFKDVDKATVTGWGVLEQNSLDFSNVLQAGEMDIINDNVCSELLGKFCNRNWCGLQDHQFCAGKMEGGVDACQGDSGGPLQIRIPLPDYILDKSYYVIGVTSFGVGCARPGLPGIYSKVSSFLDWIEPIVWS